MTLHEILVEIARIAGRSAAHPLAQRRAAAYRLRGRGRGAPDRPHDSHYGVTRTYGAQAHVLTRSEKAVRELGYRGRAPAKAFEDAVLWLREQELL